MLTTKLVVRAMDAERRMLGWVEVEAEARGDGKLWLGSPAFLPIECVGTVAYLSIHWCDVNVEITQVTDAQRVVPGQALGLPGDWPAMTVGDQAGGLPPVTVREAITIGVPVGALGGRGN